MGYGDVDDVESVEHNGPFGDASECIPISNKAVDKLSLGIEDYIEQFLDMWASSLGLGQHLADEVNGPLYLEYVALILLLHH